jgi:hypothetical protein
VLFIVEGQNPPFKHAIVTYSTAMTDIPSQYVPLVVVKDQPRHSAMVVPWPS